MREASATKDNRECAATRLMSVVLFVALCTLTSGCFVLTSEWRNMPDAPPHAIEAHDSSEGKAYSRLFETREMKLQVTVENGPIRWEAPFLFYIIPIPTSCDYLATQPLRVDVMVQPRLAQIAFEPWQTFFVGTNHMRVPPAHVWQNQRSNQTNVPTALPVTTNTLFILEFSPWDQVSPDRALPFQLSIEGLGASGQTISLPPIAFKPKPSVRPGFRLPY
jgi:hypothetical protein